MKKSKALRDIWYKLPTKQRYLIRRLYYLPADTLDLILGKRHKYVPPRGYIYTGSPASAEDYLRQGKHQVNLLEQYIDLKPTEAVLDIGSGIGRTAIALTDFLGKEGIYEGFDVVERGVEWCTKKIHSDFPNFNFTYVPLFNDLYNNARLKAEEFTFPYPNNSFDKVFSFSVFTHMQLQEIAHYLKEIERVLKPGGKMLSTFFLYDTENAEKIANRKPFGFPIDRDGYKLMDETVTGGNIALHKETLKEISNVASLPLQNIVEGFWKDDIRNKSKIEYQDIAIFKK